MKHAPKPERRHTWSSSLLALRSQRGSALMVSLVVVIIVAGLGGAFVMQSLSSTRSTTSNTQLKEAKLIADAGLEKARRYLWLCKANGWWDWNSILTYNKPATWTSSYTDYTFMSEDPALIKSNYDYYNNQGYYNWSFGTPSAGQNTWDWMSFGVNTPYGQGVYHVRITDNYEAGEGAAQNDQVDTDNHVYVAVTATMPDGTQWQSKALVEWQPSEFVPTAAITADGNFLVNGTPNIMGTMGSIHANGSLSLVGNPTISQNASATGNVTVNGAPNIGGAIINNAATVPVPDIYPWQFWQYSDYYMTWGGYVYDRNWNLIADANMGNWNNWKFMGNGNWQNASNTSPTAATYYVNGNVTIKHVGNVTPQQFTIIADGSIDISSKASWKPFLQNSIAMVAGGDLKITGNPGSKFEGVYMCQEQLKVAGTPDVPGTFVVKNKYDYSNLVTTGSSADDAGQVSGTMTITYNGGLTTLLQSAGLSCRIKTYEKTFTTTQ